MIIFPALACFAVSFGCNSPNGAPNRHSLEKPASAIQSQPLVREPEAATFTGVLEASTASSLPSTIRSRFKPPTGYDRLEAAPHSFAAYLQNLPLKPAGAVVKYYNGQVKNKRGVYIAVVDIDVGTRDLQQCADAVMRLRAEHLWAQQAYDDIHFNFSNGFRVDYLKWREGYRVKIDGNTTNWYKAAGRDTSYRSFRRYLDLVFAYAGTWSLSRELNPVSIADLQIGDVFIQGGSPGHAVIVVDMAVQPGTGRKAFLLAQSYMPAQDIHILQNPGNDALNPWYELDSGETLHTPEWRFRAGNLMRFP